MRSSLAQSPYRTPPASQEMSQQSLDSTASSAVSERSSSVNIVTKVFSFCFSGSDTTSPREVAAFPKSNSFPSVSSTSSANSDRRPNGGGVLSSKSTHIQPGGMSLTLPEIKKATKNFSVANKIGQGAFGTVYKGTLKDGTVVAIKRANKDDKTLNVSFHNEISTLKRIEHLCLVRFFGYLETNEERLIITEYIPNGTLREHLDCVHGKPLEFYMRLEIAIDVAHAITYLHMYSDHPIIHRDIKSSNILLTDNLRAKVADFGFARLGSTDAEVTHVITEVKGTVGYLDPEYLISNQLTVKSDVYSFGMLLVELLSGRLPIEPNRPSKERQTSRWAMKQYTDGNYAEVLDPKIPQSEATNLALERMLKLAFRCLSPTKQGRPSMKHCGEYLWDIRKDYRALVSPDLPSPLTPKWQPPMLMTTLMF